MNATAIITAVIVIGVLGLVIGLFLGTAALKLKVETDPKEEAVLQVLPGNNCGGCGYAGCSALAAAIAKGEAPVNACPVGGDAVGAKVAEIMGVEADSSTRMVAYVKCNGDCTKAETEYEYSGVQDCRMAALVPGKGPKKCNYGCMGYGSCVKVCPFDAIHIVKGIAYVDKDACKACGKCVAVCPNHLIELIPYEAEKVVACASNDKGPVVMKACSGGCIGCGLCNKNCEHDAVHVENFLAKIDYEKCTGCGACQEKCPKKCIQNH